MKNQKAIKVLFFSTFMALSRIFILKNRKATFYVTLRFFSKSRSDVIRTRDLYVPNVALYQAEPHSVFCNYGKGIRTPTNRVRVCCATITPFRNVLCSLANKYYYTYISKNCKHFFKFFFIFLFFLTIRTRNPLTLALY